MTSLRYIRKKELSFLLLHTVHKFSLSGNERPLLKELRWETFLTSFRTRIDLRKFMYCLPLIILRSIPCFTLSRARGPRVSRSEWVRRYKDETDLECDTLLTRDFPCLWGRKIERYSRLHWGLDLTHVSSSISGSADRLVLSRVPLTPTPTRPTGCAKFGRGLDPESLR